MNSFEMDISFNNEYNNTIIIYKLKKKLFIEIELEIK